MRGPLCAHLTLPLARQLDQVFGPGVASYFKLLRWLCVVTTVNAATSYATNCGIALAAAADPRVSSPSGIHQIAKVTLWPLQLLVDPAAGTASSSFGPTGSAARTDKRAALLAMSCLDLAAVLSLFVALAVLRRRQQRGALEQDLATVSIDDYSLQLYGFPRVPLHPQEVSTFLEEVVPELRGLVVEVTVARAYGEYLRHVNEAESAEYDLDELLSQSAAAGQPVKAAKQAALREKCAQLREQLARMEERHLPAVAAFVTFDTVDARDAAATAFPGGPLRASLPALSRIQRFRGTHVLRASPVGDPGNVLWEHMHYTAWGRARRAVLSLLCTLTLLLITTALVVGAKQFDNKVPPYVECSTATTDTSPLPCNRLFGLAHATDDADPARTQILAVLGSANAATCDTYISSADQFIPNLAPLAPLRVGSMQNAPDPLALECGAAACYGCYCSTQLLTVRDWYTNKHGLKAFCRDYWSKIVSAWALKGVSIVSVIAVNITFLVVMPRFTRLEKLPTRGQNDTANVFKICAASFFNAFWVTLAVYANITRIASDFPLVFRGPYADFTPSWYISIGSALFITVCTQLVQPSAQSFAIAYMHHRRHRRVARQHSQRALNALMVGPTWQLSFRVAKVLATTWLALALSGGIPGVGLMLPFGLWLAYFADKWFLCHTSCTPPRYQDAMTLAMRNSLVWAIWLHLALTAWMFGSPALPAYTTGSAASTSKQNGRDAYAPRPRTSNDQFDVAVRLQRWQCLVQSVPFFALSCWLILIKPYRFVLLRLLRAVCRDPSRAVPKDLATFTTFTAAKESGQLTGVASYHILSNDAYADLVRPLFKQAAAGGGGDSEGPPAEDNTWAVPSA